MTKKGGSRQGSASDARFLTRARQTVSGRLSDLCQAHEDALARVPDIPNESRPERRNAPKSGTRSWQMYSADKFRRAIPREVFEGSRVVGREGCQHIGFVKERA